MELDRHTICTIAHLQYWSYKMFSQLLKWNVSDSEIGWKIAHEELSVSALPLPDYVADEVSSSLWSRPAPSKGNQINIIQRLPCSDGSVWEAWRMLILQVSLYLPCPLRLDWTTALTLVHGLRVEVTWFPSARIIEEQDESTVNSVVITFTWCGFRGGPFIGLGPCMTK